MSNQSNNKNKDHPKDYIFPEEEQPVYGVDIPVSPHTHSYDRIPSGYDPMGEIELRGRSYRSLASGRMPIWVLIGGWIFFGIPAFILSILVLMTGQLMALPVFLMANIVPWVLWRGTRAHFRKQKKRHR